MDESETIVKELPTAILRWYEFRPGSKTLYIGDKHDAIADMLTYERQLDVKVSSLEEMKNLSCCYEYIVCIAHLELQKNPMRCLRQLYDLLMPAGILFLCMNNRLGIKYFCGDKDIYTGNTFDGIENYRNVYGGEKENFKGRMYSRSEIETMLKMFPQKKFYSVLPDLRNPSFLYADNYINREDFCNRVFPAYQSPETVFMEEEGIYQSLVDNQIFDRMANAYLIECSKCGVLSKALHVTSSLDRGSKRAMVTVLYESDCVVKKAAYKDGISRLEQLADNMEQLKKHGIRVVPGELSLRDGSYSMPYIKEDTGQIYLKRLFLEDREAFLREMDIFRDLILLSTDTYIDEQGELILENAYLDMVPLNSFFSGGEYVFYDQEFSARKFPFKAMMARVITSFYARNVDFYRIMSPDVLYKRYGLLDKIQYWLQYNDDFLKNILNKAILSDYYSHVRRDMAVLKANRERMNFSASAYEKHVLNLLEGADTRRLIVFGSGARARRFLSMYGEDYPVYAIIDNDSSKWSKEIEGVAIYSPDLLLKLRHGMYKVVVCIKDYEPVVRQLKRMGIVEYGIFDPERQYLRRRHPVPKCAEHETEDSKPYHIGYIAGVFDLFHVGHLNMFKRAKEKCDYLLVGVVSDEGVRQFKHVEPFVPFEERIELVRACRYVDEAVKIPLYFNGTPDAWKMHGFDVQFSGSDYIDAPSWIAKREFLEEHGATLEFFQYTQSTSSSKLKELIRKRLLLS